ncbi:MAG TPA: hypothetical protein VGM90_18850 [Kofleriaceae bacterium]|jgi:hypothetical protein
MKKLSIIVAIALLPAVAVAEPTVLAVDGEKIYVDLGAKDGVGQGSELQLDHEVVVKDPRSGATLRDRFALGTLVVEKSGDKISVARADGTLAKRILAGDHVVLLSSPRHFVDPWQVGVDLSTHTLAAAGTPAAGASAVAIDHVALAGDAWRDTLGKAPEQRIARWQKLLKEDPRTTYSMVIANEIASLQVQITARDEALARARSVDANDRNPRIQQLADELARTQQESSSPLVAVAPLVRALPGHPLQMAFLVRRPTEIGEAWLYTRAPGAPGFTRQPLRRDGDTYLRATVDGRRVVAGPLAWYVEATDPTQENDTGPVLGSQQQPELIQIDEDVTEPAIEAGRSHIDAHVDYVDFDGKLNKGFDQYYQAEMDFTYRFLEPVYAVRLGFGTLSGTGGPKDVIDADQTHQCLDSNGDYRCKRVNFTYVYTELEFRLKPTIALMIRPQAGLLTTDDMPTADAGRCRNAVDTAGCKFSTGLGARARVRFGAENSTNLAIGASFTDGVGTLLEAAYHWLPNPVVPVQLTVQVTDMPLPEDFGVRLIGDVGWKSLSWFYPSVRVSYQARDIDHSGFSGGMAMNFDW